MKRQTVKRVCAGLAALMCAAFPAFGESGVFTNTAASVTRDTFKSLAQWTNETGSAVSSLPFSTSAATADTAILGPIAGYQKIGIPSLTTPATPCWFGSLIGEALTRVLTFDGRAVNNTFADPTGFKGIFQPNGRYVQLASTSTADFTPTFGQIQTWRGVRLSNYSVVNTGYVRADDIFGFGTIGINATGSYTATAKGDVEIGKAGPWQSVFVARGNSNTAQGGVAFRGQAADVRPGVPGDPWMHLDAMAESTVVLNGSGEVTLWSDVRSADYPYADPITERAGTATNHPEKPTVKTIGGRRFVDFGAYEGQVQQDWDNGVYSPSDAEISRYGKPAALKWSRERKDITDVFYVFQDTQPSNTLAWPIGSNRNESKDFRRGDRGALFYWGSGTGILTGRIAVDGVRVPYYWSDDFSCRPHVISVNGSCAMAAGAFAIYGEPVAGRILRSVGGARLGEVLVYTNKLTAAEIAQVERYLVEKWVEPENRPASDLETLAYETTALNTKLAVNGAGEFAVRDVRFPADQTTFVKQGEGTFVADRVTPKNLSIKVNGGAFKFRSQAEPIDDLKPAADPYLWLDATADASLAKETVNGTNFVTRWNDCRPAQGAYFARLLTADKRPFLVPDALNGKAVLDFGPQGAASGTYAAFKIDYPSFGSAVQYPYLEGFIVYKTTDPSAFTIPIATSAHKLREKADETLTERSQSGDVMMGCRYRLNGVPMNSIEQEGSWKNPNRCSFCLYSIEAPARFDNNFIEANRLCGMTDDKRGGGAQIAEVIYYSRHLTPTERRNTEAYLMKKWGLGPHPEATDWTHVPTMTFADGVAPVVASDTALDVSNLVTTASTLVKEGKGAITVAQQPAGVTSYAVKGGTLNAGYCPDLTLIPSSFHVDAEDTASFVFEPGSETNVTNWYDTTGNGKFAAAENVAQSKHPELKVSDGTDGLESGHPYVDFGVLDGTPQSYTSSMRWNLADKTKNWDVQSKEVHIVLAKRAGAPAFPLGNASRNGTNLDKIVSLRFTTSGNQMFDETAKTGNADCTNLWCLVDDDYVWHRNAWSGDSDSDPGTTFHVVTLVLRNGFTFGLSNFASAWANGPYGGVKIAECIVFDGTNSTFAAEALHSKLLKKWRGIGDGRPKGTVALGSVEIADGATFNYTSPLVPTIGSLTGGGTFASEVGIALEEGAVLETAYLGEKTFSRTTADCAVTLPASATVNVSIPRDIARRDLVGRYRIFAATSISGAENVADWTIVGTDGRTTEELRALGATLAADSTGIYLVIPPHGIVLIVR